MDIRKDILWRVYLCFLGMIVLGMAVLGRAFYIQRIDGNRWREMGKEMHVKYMPIEAERGTIYSEDGNMLSTSVPIFDVFIDFGAEGLHEKNGERFKKNIDSLSMKLADLFKDKTAAAYKKELQQGFKEELRYYTLKKKISFSEYKALRDFPLVRLGRNKSGFIIDPRDKRINPYVLLANRTIGLSREDSTKNVGLERTYDSLLKGASGQRLMRYVAGAYLPVEGGEVEAENGKDIITTLDTYMQDVTEAALMKMVSENNSLHGTAIVMETATGEIKAMANLGRQKDGSYYEDDNYALRATEPGSTIKLATLLSVLDKGSSKPTDMVEIGGAGRAKVGNKMVTDAERSPKPFLTVQECFAHSSNIGMSKLALKAFGENPIGLKEYLHKYRLDVKSPIDLTDVPKPTMAPLDQKGSAQGNMLWMSFGYGIQVSPLQILTLYNAIANNGRMMKPFLVSNIQSNGIIRRKFDPVVISENICKPSVVADARKAMEMVVTEGTARKAMKGLPFAVAGKTGTAHVSDGKIKYADGVYQATFVGYFPADKPQYTCIVVIRTNPHDPVHYGGSLGAPVFREIATKLYPQYVEQKNATQYAVVIDSSNYFYAGLSSDIRKVFADLKMRYQDSVQQNKWGMVYASNYQALIKTNTVNQQLMPNVKGMGLKDALYLLENMGVKVKISGKGKVSGQSIAPGTALAKGLTVILDLS